MTSEYDRYRGALLGLACGDALGTTVQYMPRGSFAPLTDIVGGGPFELRAGDWTDATSMALCLAHSLVYRRAFDPIDQMNRYCNWYNVGYMSSTGDCFDIGNSVGKALRYYLKTNDPFAGSPNPDSAGSGALMRLAPIVMFYALNEKNVLHYSGESTRTTHGAQEAIDCSRLFGLQLRQAILGHEKLRIIEVSSADFTSKKVEALVAKQYISKNVSQIKATRFAADSLEAALWCFWHTSTFEDAVLKAANLGGISDTTAAICGQLAGAYYGAQSIPSAWIKKLAMADEICELTDKLYECRWKEQFERA